MEATTEAPAAAATEPAAELTLDQIVAEAVQAADASGAEVVQDTDSKATATGDTVTPAAAETTAAATTEETPATEEKLDDVSARRVRTMLAKLESREQELAAREAQLGGNTLAELLKSPKAFLARHGKSIDDVIDASLAEGKDKPVAAAEGDDNPRLTALEKRIEERELAESNARNKAVVDAKVAEIHGQVAASPKYPVLNELKRHSLVTDYMLEYHALHGKAISWDRAAAAIESDLTGAGIATAKKLGWAPPAAKPAVPGAVPARADTVSIGGNAREAAPTTGEEPDDPEQLMKYLVAQAGLSG